MATLKNIFAEDSDENWNSKELISTTTKELQNGLLDLLELIEAMEPAMNNKSSSKRIQAMDFLSNTFKNIQKSLLSSTELQFICSFLVGRLSSDHHVCSSVLDLILLLLDQDNILDKHVCDMLNGIFREVNCQSLIMTERRTIYSIFNKCLQEHFKAVSSMSAEFILGFIAAFDSETDPRNLMLVFSFYPFIARNIPLGSYGEDMFEVVAAYFPINFVAPSHVENPISNEALICSLRECMTASESILPFCIPFIIEKIGNDAPSLELEALNILQACCKKYSAEGLSPHLWALLFMLYNLAIGNVGEEVVDESIKCIAIIAALYAEEDISSNCAKNATETVSSLIEECLPKMINPGQNPTKPYCRILSSVGAGAKFLAELICLKAVPTIIDVYQHASISDKKNILIIITDLLKCASSKKIIFEDKLCRVQTDFFDIYYSLVKSKNDEFLVLTMNLFSKNVSSFTEDQVSTLMLSALKYPKLYEIRSVIEFCLSSCCDEYPEMVAGNIIDYMMEHINLNNTDKNNSYFMLLPSTCRHHLVLNKILPILWDFLQLSFLTPDIVSLPLLEVTLQCFNTASDCKLMDMSSLHTEWDNLHNLAVISLRLIKCQPTDLLRDLEIMARISHYFVSRTEQSTVQSLIELLIGNEEAVAKLDLNTDAFSQLTDLTDAKNIKEGYIVYPIFGVICNADCINAIDTDLMNSLQMALVHLSCFSTNSNCRALGSKTYSLLLNLLNPGYAIQPLLDYTKKFVIQNLNSDNKQMQESALNLNFWTAKGLIMRDYNDALEYVVMLENHLLSKEFGDMASDLYGILLQDFSDLFRKSLGANVRLLYKQRYFEERIDTMLQQFNQTESCGRYNTQMAILKLLPYLPDTILYCNLSKVLPILLGCLTSPNENVVLVGVSCLLSLIPKAPLVFVEHLTNLIPGLVKHSQSTDIHCRQKCLECSVLVSDLPSIKILPYRDEVLVGLQKALNDKKRVIRKVAALAVSLWEVVGA